ncbi:hypothetical protein [Amycolatopsis sacchari]|uniref:Uncharacterized protein n=1 Tax=Amycolatopsis sacchari TaxID=115433 RepID=A0A1I3M0G5_9PSEU|nr:hypothetical protein [Amycolatopsis sacchari]SFI90463.1 hypothetical protein SAMN05421835_102125 [Amycolatopsis sacchari]
MTDDKPPEPEPKPPETPENPPPQGNRDAEDSSGAQPPGRDEAVKQLRGEASALSTARFGKITAEGIGRLEGLNVNVFQGEFTVEGDFLTGGGERRRAPRRVTTSAVSAEAIAEVDDHFVRPADFESGVDVLSTGNLVVFSGPETTGRRTRALATVLTVLRERELPGEVLTLGEHVLGNPNWRIPPGACGLLVVDRPNAQRKYAAEGIGDLWLTETSKRLAGQGAFLAVVTGPVRGSLASAPRASDFVLDDLELPDPMEIVRKRVRGELPWLAGELDDRLAGTELALLLAERDDPGFAQRAAAAVSEALRTEADLAAAVAKLRNAEEQVREWLDRAPELEEIAFVLATATLEGASYLSIADAAVALYRKLSGKSGALTPRYLRGLAAGWRWIDRTDTDGTPTLRFRHDRLRPVVLALTWTELDGARADVLDWLKSLNEHSDVEVRARAAQAAGLLANNDFDHGVHRFLLPWAGAASLRLRQSAAYGLNVAATLGRHADRAWSYVEQWADLVHSTGSRRLPATAAIAAGGPLGVRYPDRALRVLRALVCDGHWGLLEPAAVSTQALLEAGRVGEVLTALLDWTKPARVTEPVEKALTMFAFAALPPDSSAHDWPLLLRHADEHREALPELWGRALACEPVRPLALDALREWVRVADRDDEAFDVVLSLLGGIADRGESDYSRLCHALYDWATDRELPSDAAAELHDELVEAGEGPG